jgi:hypothetical protein
MFLLCPVIEQLIHAFVRHTAFRLNYKQSNKDTEDTSSLYISWVFIALSTRARYRCNTHSPNIFVLSVLILRIILPSSGFFIIFSFFLALPLTVSSPLI